MIVTVTRSGGLGGLTLRGELDTTTLSPAERAAAEAAFTRLPAGSRTPPAGPDRFQYDIAVTTDDGATRRATVHEPDVPAELRDLLERVIEQSRSR